MDLIGQTFVRGAELANGKFILCTQDDSVDTKTHPHTGFIYWTPTDGWTEIGIGSKMTVDAGLSGNGESLLLADPFGFVTEEDGTDVHKDHLTDPSGKPLKHEMRCIRGVGDHVFAGGVARQVFERDATKKWRLISPPEMLSSNAPNAVQGIDGMSISEIYTAGWGGEIWHFDGKNWRQLNSPTNIILNDICAGPNLCAAVGLAGQIVVGRGDNWEMIEHDETEEAFWSVRAYEDAFYLAALSGVYRLKDGELSLFRGIDDGMRTAYALSVGPSGLWSIGSQDVALFDGTSWRTIGQS